MFPITISAYLQIFGSSRSYIHVCIYIYTYIHTYICIYINFVCQVLMSEYIYKKLRHLFTNKSYFGFFQTFKDSNNKIYIHIYIFTYIYVYMYILCIYIHIYKHMYIYIYIGILFYSSLLSFCFSSFYSSSTWSNCKSTNQIRDVWSRYLFIFYSHNNN